MGVRTTEGRAFFGAFIFPDAIVGERDGSSGSIVSRRGIDALMARRRRRRR